MLLLDVVNGLYTNGKAKLYFKNNNYNDKAQRVIEFSIDENGKLKIEYKIEMYDRVFWNGRKTNSFARLEETFKLCEYDEDNMSMPVASLLYSTLFNFKDLVEYDYSSSYVGEKENGKVAINELYSLAYSMLSVYDKYEAQNGLNDINNIIYQSIKGSNDSTINILLEGSKKFDAGAEGLLDYKEILLRLSNKTTEVKNKLIEAKQIWANALGEKVTINPAPIIEIEPFETLELAPHLSNLERFQKSREMVNSSDKITTVVLKNGTENELRAQAINALSKWMDDRCISSYQAQQWIHVNIGNDSIYINEEGYNTLISRLVLDTNEINPEFSKELSKMLYHEMALQMEIDPNIKDEHFTYADYTNTYTR